MANVNRQEMLDECCLDCNPCLEPHKINQTAPGTCKATPGFKQLPSELARRGQKAGEGKVP